MARLSRAARNALANQLAAVANLGVAHAGARLRINAGAPPASPDLPWTAAALAAFELADPPFRAALDGVLVANAITSEVLAASDGRASWFRLLDRDGNGVMDGTVSLVGEGGEVQLNTLNIRAGRTVTLGDVLIRQA